MRTKREEDVIRKVDTMLKLEGLPTWSGLIASGEDLIDTLGPDNLLCVCETHIICSYCSFKELVERGKE